MPLPIKDRKIGAIEYVIKRIKGSDNYDKMKDHNEYGSEKMVKRDQPESDYRIGMKQAVNEMMDAVGNKDQEAFEKGLRAFVSMMVDNAMDEHNMYYHKDDMKEMLDDEN